LKIWKNNKNGLLYLIAKVSPPKFTGSWYEAIPYLHSIEVNHNKKRINLDDFTLVGQR